MLGFLKWFLGLFSPYVHPFERRVDRFFRNITSDDNSANIRKKLLEFMQEDLVVLNVWLEKKFKGYRYLKKNVRRQMYEDTKKIVKKFEEFQATHRVIKNQKKLNYLAQIMAFLRPGAYYKYIETASFGKLLCDPNQKKLQGDCNQIVTLYVYLYSLKFPIEDLQIKLLPGHVCLHFQNTDIEATNGQFRKYTKYDHILPITEIISTNLLDLSDFREDVQQISERSLLKSAQLAYAISSLKSLVAKNLNIAYKNLANAAIRVKDFETAAFYLSKAGDSETLRYVYHDAAVYYMKKNNFLKARVYAGKIRDPELTRILKQNEGIYYFEQGQLEKALEIFSFLGDEKMKKVCYAWQYNDLVKKISGDKTLDDARRHKSVYKKMLDLARKMGDSRLEKGVSETLKKV